jgi:colanic acid/amylovoran biosynthesis glycosyltransferase
MTLSNDTSTHENQSPNGISTRLVLFVKAFPQRSETFIVQKFLGLLEKGWDVHVVCGRSSTKEWDLFPRLSGQKELRNRIHISWPERSKVVEALLFPFLFLRCLVLAPKSSLQYLVRGWNHFGFYTLHLFYVDAEMIILHPALIHFEFGSLAIGRMHIKEFLCCRITVSFRGADISFTGLDKPDFYHQVWEQADALHLVGEDLWKRSLQRGCPGDKPHSVISPAIDPSFFVPETKKITESVGTQSRPYRILSVGRLVWKKGYEFALRAVRCLLDQGIYCEYRIIGSGDYMDAIRFTIRDLEMENDVKLLGPMSRAEVKTQLELADVFLLASVSEGLSNAVLEAQAMTLPVVSTDAGDAGIANEETGFIIPRRDWQTMAEKLAKLAADPGLRVRMGQAGRQRVMEKFQVATQTESFNRFYHQVLA